jgi:hypothetical protein
MLYRRFPGCRKRRSAHTTSHGRCQVRQGWLATPVSSDVGTSRLGRRCRDDACPACQRPRCGIGPNQAGLCTQSGGGINRQPGRCGICSDLIRSCRKWAGRTRCYTVRGLCISTLHVSLIIRVLPRAESAAGCIYRERRYCAGAIHVQGRYFRSIRRALRGSDWRAEVRRKNPVSSETLCLRFFQASCHLRLLQFQALLLAKAP